MGDKIPLMNTEQTERLFNTERKGQSAIEYLMTYGWMLLVVAIVGGAIFATVQGQCTQSSSGFTGQDIQVADFGVTGGDTLTVELRNAGAERITVNQLTMTNTDDEVQVVTNSTASYYDADTTDSSAQNVGSAIGSDNQIDVGDSTTFTLPNVESTEGCNTFDFAVDYDQGNLDNQRLAGTLTDSIQFFAP